MLTKVNPITMEQLLSGFAGALIATILSVIYLYFSEKSKIRTELVLEIVGFCDEFYNLIINLKYLKNIEFTKPGSQIDIEEYRAFSKSLTNLIITTKLQAKTALIYKESEVFKLFMELSNCFRDAASILRKSTRSGWVIEEKEISELLISKIEPLRKDLLTNLLKSTSVTSITKNILYNKFIEIKKY